MKITGVSQVKAFYKSSLSTFLYTYLRYWEYPRLEKIEKMIPEKGVILDLGSGYGIFSNYVAARNSKRKVIGLEFNGGKTNIAKIAAESGNIQNISFISKDITNTSIPRVDVIILMHVLHHINGYKEQEKLIVECIKKLKPEGIMIIDEVEKKFGLKLLLTFLADTFLYLGDKFYYRSRKDMSDLLNKLSLKVEIKNVDGFLMPFSEVVYICKKE